MTTFSMKLPSGIRTILLPVFRAALIVAALATSSRAGAPVPPERWERAFTVPDTTPGATTLGMNDVRVLPDGRYQVLLCETTWLYPSPSFLITEYEVLLDLDGSVASVVGLDTNGSCVSAVPVTSGGVLAISYSRAIRIDEHGSPIWSAPLPSFPTNESTVYLTSLETSDGGFIVDWTIENEEVGLEGMFTTRLGPTGSVLWSRDEGPDSGLRGVYADGLYAASGDDFFVVGDAGTGYALARFGGDGRHQWTRPLGDPGFYLRQLSAVPDGGFLMIGSIPGATPTVLGLGVTRIDAAGDVQWRVRYATSQDVGVGTAVRTENGWLFPLNTGGPNPQLYALRIADDGTASAGGPYFSGGIDAAVVLAPQGRSFLAGVTYDTRHDLFVVLLDSDLRARVTRKLPLSTELDYPSFEPTKDGGFLVSGIVPTDEYDTGIAAARVGAAGKLLWSRLYGSFSETDLPQVRSTADGGFLLGANVADRTSSPVTVPYPLLIKMDANGVTGPLIGSPPFSP